MPHNHPRRESLAIPKPERDIEQIGLERLVFFSDAVFAIAITLLALEIRLPADTGPLNDVQLFNVLRSLWPKYVAYVISFLVIGVFWMGHHRRYSFIVRYDRTSILLNLLHLMVIAFIPFPTSVMSEQGNRTGTIFYALTIVLAGFFVILLWRYSTHNNRLVEPDLSPHIRRRETLRQLTVPFIFLLSIPLAFVNTNLTRPFWLLIIPLLRLIH